MKNYVLYFTHLNSNTISVGIWKKVLMQIEFFKRSNFNVKMVDTSFREETFLNKIKKRLPLQSINNWQISTSDLVKANVIYIRYSKSDFGMLSFLRKVKSINNKIKIVIEIPTYPYDREEKMNISNFTILVRDRFYRKKLKKYVDIILTYSDDEEIWGIKTIRLSNVVDFRNISLRQTEKEANEIINLVGVATLSFWHGYDRLIQGLYNYVKSTEQTNIKLHIVGDGPAFKEYDELVKKLKMEHMVTMHGRKQGKELDAIYDFCEIGIDALGRHRSGVEYNSSLKGKEYGAKGLPIISGVRTELDLFDNFSYYLKVPSNDNPINIEDVINFYQDIYKNSNKNEIVNEIRKFNEKNFSLEVNWKKVIEFMDSSN